MLCDNRNIVLWAAELPQRVAPEKCILFAYLITEKVISSLIAHRSPNRREKEVIGVEAARLAGFWGLTGTLLRLRDTFLGHPFPPAVPGA
jgi:hypothetical protein